MLLKSLTASRSFINLLKPVQLNKQKDNSFIKSLILLSRKYSTMFTVPEVVSTLNEISPVEFASDWDNVGLLIKPTTPPPIDKIMVTEDLTEIVVRQAINQNVHFIISYHPPIFKSLKSLNSDVLDERKLVLCLENKISVYSPHTSLDALNGGVNDFLLNPFKLKHVSPIEQSFTDPQNLKCIGHKYSILFFCQNEKFLAELPNFNCQVNPVNSQSFEYCVNCNDDFPSIIRLFEKHEVSIKSVNIIPKLPSYGTGMGRIGILETPDTISNIVESVKKLLELDQVRVGFAKTHSPESIVKSISVCAGSGFSVLKNVKSDVIITGELSHHQILDFSSRGITSIVCGHSNTEWPFIKTTYKDIIENKLKIPVVASDGDPNPLTRM